METKHTRGPWKLDEFNKVVDSDGNPIKSYSHIAMGGYTEERMANLKLIAAAPELLEESIKLIETLKWMCNAYLKPFTSERTNIEQQIIQLENKIKKVTE